MHGTEYDPFTKMHHCILNSVLRFLYIECAVLSVVGLLKLNIHLQVYGGKEMIIIIRHSDESKYSQSALKKNHLLTKRNILIFELVIRSDLGIDVMHCD